MHYNSNQVGDFQVSDSVKELTQLVKDFCEARDWDQFHSPKDLAIGVITEASELLEHFRFLSEEESLSILKNPTRKSEIEDEVADVLFFLLRFSQMYEIDLGKALKRKVEKTEKKYPVEKARGKNSKYTDL
jgi:NTP pyrophosphatase (non-canonical NTP hydrolase)